MSLCICGLVSAASCICHLIHKCMAGVLGWSLASSHFLALWKSVYMAYSNYFSLASRRRLINAADFRDELF